MIPQRRVKSTIAATGGAGVSEYDGVRPGRRAASLSVLSSGAERLRRMISGIRICGISQAQPPILPTAFTSDVVHNADRGSPDHQPPRGQAAATAPPNTFESNHLQNLPTSRKLPHTNAAAAAGFQSNQEIQEAPGPGRLHSGFGVGQEGEEPPFLGPALSASGIGHAYLRHQEAVRNAHSSHLQNSAAIGPSSLEGRSAARQSSADDALDVVAPADVSCVIRSHSSGSCGSAAGPGSDGPTVAGETVFEGRKAHGPRTSDETQPFAVRPLHSAPLHARDYTGPPAATLQSVSVRRLSHAGRCNVAVASLEASQQQRRLNEVAADGNSGHDPMDRAASSGAARRQIRKRSPKQAGKRGPSRMGVPQEQERLSLVQRVTSSLSRFNVASRWMNPSTSARDNGKAGNQVAPEAGTDLRTYSSARSNSEGGGIPSATLSCSSMTALYLHSGRSDSQAGRRGPAPPPRAPLILDSPTSVVGFESVLVETSQVATPSAAAAAGPLPPSSVTIVRAPSPFVSGSAAPQAPSEPQGFTFNVPTSGLSVDRTASSAAAATAWPSADEALVSGQNDSSSAAMPGSQRSESSTVTGSAPSAANVTDAARPLHQQQAPNEPRPAVAAFRPPPLRITSLVDSDGGDSEGSCTRLRASSDTSRADHSAGFVARRPAAPIPLSFPAALHASATRAGVETSHISDSEADTGRISTHDDRCLPLEQPASASGDQAAGTTARTPFKQPSNVSSTGSIIRSPFNQPSGEIPMAEGSGDGARQRDGSEGLPDSFPSEPSTPSTAAVASAAAAAAGAGEDECKAGLEAMFSKPIGQDTQEGGPGNYASRYNVSFVFFAKRLETGCSIVRACARFPGYVEKLSLMFVLFGFNILKVVASNLTSNC